MTEPVILAIDQGSSSTKGAAFGLDGRIVARAERAVATARHGDRVEHDPEELVASVAAVLAEIGGGGSRSLGVAIACQRSTCLLWDRATGRPLTPALSWQDLRATARTEALAEDAERIAERTGLRLSPHYAGPKLALLLADGERMARAAAGEIVAGTLDAFLVHRLAGIPLTEPGHAGRTLLHDLDRNRWDPWLASRFGVPAAALPELGPSAAPDGPEVRGTGAPLLVRLGDQQAALLAAGGGDPETVAVHFGTGAFLLATSGSRPRRHPGLLAAALAESSQGRTYQLEASVNSAGSAVDWACRLTGLAPGEIVADALDPEEGPLVVPALAGLGAPWWNPRARGLAVGLTLASSGSDLVRGVLAGVALRVVDGLEGMAAAGVCPQRVRASGRLTRLHGLPQLVADASGLPVEVLAEEEAGLAGAALLAAREVAPETPLARLAPTVRARCLPSWGESRRRRVLARWRSLLGAAGSFPQSEREG